MISLITPLYMPQHALCNVQSSSFIYLVQLPLPTQISSSAFTKLLLMGKEFAVNGSRAPPVGSNGHISLAIDPACT